MSNEMISVRTRRVFREYLVGWTLRQIGDVFSDAGVLCDLDYSPPANISGQRRTLVEQYYHTVDWGSPAGVKVVLDAYGEVLAESHQNERYHGLSGGMDDEADNERLGRMKMIAALKKDGFEVEDNRIVSGVDRPVLDSIKQTAIVFDASHMKEQIRRMESSVNSDPSLAIGTAKELIETCCKTILAERGKPVAGTPDVSTLTKATLKELKLVPEGVPDAARGGAVVKRLLQNLGTIGNGLAELRGLYGTGHGQHGNTSGLRPRHAKLAVGAAATLATFLFETHQETKAANPPAK